MGTPHYYENKMGKRVMDRIDRENGRPTKPDWYFSEQPYELDGEKCREFAEALIGVTDEVIATIHPETFAFEGTPAELKAAVIWQGRMYRKLKQGYSSVG